MLDSNPSRQGEPSERIMHAVNKRKHYVRTYSRTYNGNKSKFSVGTKN